MPDISRNLPILEDDGLHLPDVGQWGKEKYLRVWMYDQIMSTGMKFQWQMRVYLDCFAGAGRALIRETGEIVPGSPMLALNIPDPFDKYIFCEADAERFHALSARVVRDYLNAPVTLLNIDVNRDVQRAIAEIPSGRGVLSFCFVDPFSLRLHFSTIRQLAEGRPMDFLILLAGPMDAQRNQAHYVKEHHETLDLFFGSRNWRERWKDAAAKGQGMAQFIAEEYVRSMETIGYTGTTIGQMYAVRYEQRHPLYYLAFFSKNAKGHRFWAQVRKYSTAQPGFLDELFG